MRVRCDAAAEERGAVQIMDKAAHYDAQYRKPNYFGYSRWMYDRYIAALIRAAGLKRASLVLDVGCGQGLFSYLFCKHGMDDRGNRDSTRWLRCSGGLVQAIN
jgi:2-polyprenyl-3-methyl-5-hydroxy-6-metoxy-1,4-benzoquinol methylase